MYIKECKWCREVINVEKQQNFASHVAICKDNPDFEIRKKLQSEKLKGINKVARVKEIRNCLKCNNEFEIEATESEIKRNKVRKYCSTKCGNSRNHTSEVKDKISLSLKNNGNRYQPDNIGKSYKNSQRVNSFICAVCGEIGIDERYNKNRKYHKECWLSISGGVRKGSSRGKSGYYKGYWCDSSYELAYLVYCIEHNIEIERNKRGFKYSHKEKEHLFYPDFIVEGKYVEIKNFHSELTDDKIKYFPFDINVLYKDTIIPYINYVKNKYGNDFIKLYNNSGCSSVD